MIFKTFLLQCLKNIFDPFFTQTHTIIKESICYNKHNIAMFIVLTNLTYILAGFEPTFFCSVNGDNDH
jgi:hypothetical protein